MRFDLGLKKEMNGEILEQINNAPTIPWDGSCDKDGWPKFQHSGQEDVFKRLFLRVNKDIVKQDDKWVVEDGRWDFWKEDYKNGCKKKPMTKYDRQTKKACEWAIKFMEKYEKLGVRG